MLSNIQRLKPISKLGVMVADLRPSTLNHSLITFGNKLVENPEFDFYVFNEDWKRPPVSLTFPLLQQRNAWGFDGNLVATNIATAKKLLNLPNTCKKYFYVWNMIEWMNAIEKASDVLDLYHDPSLHIIARSKDNAFILQHNFNKEVQILQDFDYEQSIKLFKAN